MHSFDWIKPLHFSVQRCRVSDDETFTRLLYCGTVQMHMEAEDFWLTPFGLFMDLWERHKQFLGYAKAKRELFIDDVISDGLA